MSKKVGGFLVILCNIVVILTTKILGLVFFFFSLQKLLLVSAFFHALVSFLFVFCVSGKVQYCLTIVTTKTRD